MVAQVRGADRKVFFDSNIREKLWPDAAEMRSIITAAGAVADIVLPSLDDEKRSFGDPMRMRLLTGIGGGARKRSSSRMVWHLHCWWMRMMPSGLLRRRFIRRLTARPLAMPSMAV